MLDLTKDIYPVKDFNKGQSSKIFNEIISKNKPGLIFKNNKPILGIMPIEIYIELMNYYDNIKEKNNE